MKPGNIAPSAKVSASSTRPGYPLAAVNDGRMDTQWSTDAGKTTGQWLQFDWDSPQTVCGVAMLATGPWTQTLDVQVDREGQWVSVAKAGSPEEPAPVHAILTFAPVRTKSVRIALEGGAAYWEVEIYNDAAKMADAVAEYTKISVTMAGDLRGHLMGNVSQSLGEQAVRDAEVTVTGKTPTRPWKESAKTGRLGDFEVPLPFATIGPIEVNVAKDELVAEQTIDSRDVSTQLTPESKEARKDKLSLCGKWDFAADPPAGFPTVTTGMKWTSINVPAHWEMEGQAAESGRAVYRREFTAPEAWRGKRIKLRADAVYSHAQVWVNSL
ncbi:MAG TPA: discoidin domain-containing protein, partial [Fimbriimonadaceae bacterium]|nr:discoidin domain-containing protein [Fimbriimonadaceae bacterium]